MKSQSKWYKLEQSGDECHIGKDTDTQDMLLGQYDVKLGEKGRIALPKRFRDELGSTIIVTHGFEESLLIVSYSNWKALLEGTESKSFLQSKTRDIKRYLLGGASVIELDTQGRFVIPEYLREFAHLDEAVTIVGLHKYVEIWSGTRWRAQRERVQKDIGSLADALIDELTDTK